MKTDTSELLAAVAVLVLKELRKHKKFMRVENLEPSLGVPRALTQILLISPFL